MNDKQHLSLMHQEWDAWKELCAHMRKMGAVTDKDCHSSVRDDDTDGQKLFNLIRAWGERLVELRIARKESQ